MLLLSLAFALVSTPSSGAAPPGCRPTTAPTPIGRNIFSAEQERDLGEVMHEHLRGHYRVIEDAELSTPLTRIAERLLRHLPATSLGFRVSLTDLPVANAFAFPGGRIYVTRKLVASTRNEDELAGVVAHELGHALAHDGAVATTRRLQRDLGVDRLGDREDVRERYHQLLDAGRSGAPDDHEKAQVAADRVAIEALHCAGYRPEALADWWDRFHETGGRTGNWFSDFVGTTRPETKRLREMLRAQAALAMEGRETLPPAGDEDFRRWQAAVVAYERREPADAVAGVIWKRPLEPPLPADVDHVRFSPDGRFVLAQDPGGILVLSREPFAILFRIDAEDAAPAQFAPDSGSVVVHDRGLRVETWDVPSGERRSTREVVRRDGCAQAALSPDGRYLACYTPRGGLAVVEVDDGSVAIDANPFAPAGARFGLGRSRLRIEDAPDWLRFSPDARYLVAGVQDSVPLAFDLATRTAIRLPEVFRALTQRSFTFIGSDRLAGIDPRDPAQSRLVRFPSGEPVATLRLDPASRLGTASGGDFLFLRPFNEYPVGVMDVSTGKVVLANRAPALDVRGELAILETGDGGLDLRRWRARGGSEGLGRVRLPRGRLGRLRATALSPDRKWMVVSQSRQAAAWNLDTGQRGLPLRPFEGAYFDAAGLLYADLMADRTRDRFLAKVDVAGGRILEERPVPDDVVSAQLGSVMLAVRPHGRDRRRISALEATDTASGEPLWSRAMPELPFVLMIGADRASLALAWPVRDSGSRALLRRDPVARARLATLKEDDDGFVLEILDTRTGRTRGYVSVPVRLERFGVRGDVVLIDDTLGRVLVYSLASGELRGRLFGRSAALMPSGLLAVASTPGRMVLHDLKSLEERGELALPGRVVAAAADPDGKRLLVLAADQVVYLLDIARPATAP